MPNPRPKKRQANFKKFKLDGEITPNERNNYYYVDVRASNQLLLDMLAEGGLRFIMVRGPRGSAKSTRLLTLMEQLRGNGYACVYISLGHLSTTCESTRFWREFSQALSFDGNHPVFSSKMEFIQWLSMENKEAFGLKNVVLVVDDFQQLSNWDDTNRNELLGALGILKAQCGVTSCLSHCIAAGHLGTQKVLQIIESPFSQYEAISVPNFTEEEVSQLFSAFAEDRHLNWDDRISLDIYHRTAGFPNLVCFCGKQIQDIIEKNRAPFTYARWMDFVMKELSLLLRIEYAWFTDVIETSLQSEKTTRFMIKLLLGSERLVLPEWLSTIRLLASIGVVIQDKLECKIVSPIVRNFITEVITSQRMYSSPNEPFPMESSGSFRIVPMIIRLMHRFDQGTVDQVLNPSEDTGYPPIPCASFYHFECFAIISKWAKKCGGTVFSNVCWNSQGMNAHARTLAN